MPSRDDKWTKSICEDVVNDKNNHTVGSSVGLGMPVAAGSSVGLGSSISVGSGTVLGMLVAVGSGVDVRIDVSVSANSGVGLDGFITFGTTLEVGEGIGTF